MDPLMIRGVLEGFIKIIGIIVLLLLFIAIHGIMNTKVPGDMTIWSKGKRWVLKDRTFPYGESSRKRIREHNEKYYPDDKPQAFYSDRR